MSFQEASHIVRKTESRWTAEIEPDWDILGRTNGGYMMAIAARAMAEATDRKRPASVTAHFLAPGEPGPVTVDVEVIKRGRMFGIARATLSDSERPLITMLGSFTNESASEPVRIDAAPPQLPDRANCVSLEPTDTFPPPLLNHLDLALPPATLEAFEMPGEEARIEGWFRMRDSDHGDPMSLLVAVDAFPPTIFILDLPMAWTPTLELTTHVRDAPASEWLMGRFSTRFITGGFLEEDGEIWDEQGNLVAQSRQLAMVPRS